MSLGPFFSVDGEGSDSYSMAPWSLMNFIRNCPDALQMILSSLELHSTLNVNICEFTQSFHSQKSGENQDWNNLIEQKELVKAGCRRKSCEILIYSIPTRSFFLCGPTGRLLLQIAGDRGDISIVLQLRNSWFLDLM